MRITESQLRRIIRQEVGRLTEMAAPTAGKLAVFEFIYPDEVLPDGRTVLDTLKEEAAAKGLPAPIGPIATSIGKYVIMVGPRNALKSIGSKIDRAFGGYIVDFTTSNVEKYLDEHQKPEVKRPLNAALKKLGWTPSAPLTGMAKLEFSALLATEDTDMSVEEMQELAARLGVEGKLIRGRNKGGTFSVTGPRPAVEKFALEMENAYYGGAQSIDQESGLFSMIKDVR
jgi:hypothetical protein